MIAFERDHDRAEGKEQEQEGESEEEGKHERGTMLHRLVEVVRAGGDAGDGLLRTGGRVAITGGITFVRRV